MVKIFFVVGAILALLFAGLCHAEDEKRCVDLDAISDEERGRLLNETVHPRLAELYRQYIRYPHEALSSCVEGSVRLKIIVDTKGRIDKIELMEGSGSTMLDESALEQAQQIASILKRKPLVKKGHCLTDDLELIFSVEYEIPPVRRWNCEKSESLPLWKADPVRQGDEFKGMESIQKIKESDVSHVH